MRSLIRVVKVLRINSHPRKVAHKFNLEQRLNDSPTSTASPGEYRTFFSLLDMKSVPTEFSSKLTSYESDKLSAPPGAPIYTTGAITLNFDIATTRTTHKSFSANNPNLESNLPKQRVSFDNIDGSGSLTTTRSVGEGMSSNLPSRS